MAFPKAFVVIVFIISVKPLKYHTVLFKTCFIKIFIILDILKSEHIR